MQRPAGSGLPGGAAPRRRRGTGLRQCHVIVLTLTIALGVAFEQADAFLRRWSSARISLLSLVALFGGLLLVGAPK